MKLQIKVPFLVIIILLIIGLFASAILLNFQQKASIKQFEEMGMALAGAVQGSLEEGMMLGVRGHIQKAMERISEKGMVNNVSLFAPDGTIATSSKLPEIGQITATTQVQQALTLGKVSMLLEKQNGLSELWVITPVFNKPECQSCHSPASPVLGAIKVDLKAATVDSQIRQQTMFLVILGALTFVIIGGLLAFALKRTILNPLSRLAESAQKLSRGDYTARALSTENDEIGTLARTFNEMAESVEHRSRELETTVAERTRELEESYREIERKEGARGELLSKVLSAQEEERKRLARELHDETAQQLIALSHQLEDFTRNAEQRLSADEIELLRSWRERLKDTLQGVRLFSRDLRPPILDDLGLIPALEWLVANTRESSKVAVGIRVVGAEQRLPAEVELVLFRIAQEALRNMLRHSQATRAEATLEFDEKQVTMTISDDGKGFELPRTIGDFARTGKLGLAGMQERARLLNGTITVQSEPGKGTNITVVVPMTVIFPKL